MYEVIVGNIGTVYRGGDTHKANKTYREYVKQSKTNYGRAAGEDVTMFYRGDIRREYIGTLHADESN